MNKYIIPVCDYNESKVYNLVINANSYEACKDKIMNKFIDFSDSEDYDDFIADLDSLNILIGEIRDIEEL